MRGDSSRMIFIDSNVATHGDRVKITLPSAGFTAGSSDRMSLTLQSFSMKRNFHNIHKFNNTFYIHLLLMQRNCRLLRKDRILAAAAERAPARNKLRGHLCLGGWNCFRVQTGCRPLPLTYLPPPLWITPNLFPHFFPIRIFCFVFWSCGSKK